MGKSVPLLRAEIRDDGSIYLATVNRKYVLELIEVMVKNYAKFEERDQLQVTIFETRDVK